MSRGTRSYSKGGGDDRDGNNTGRRRRRNTSVQRPAASQSQRVRRAVWFDVAFVGYVWLARRLSVRYHRLTAKYRRTDCHHAFHRLFSRVFVLRNRWRIFTPTAVVPPPLVELSCRTAADFPEKVKRSWIDTCPERGRKKREN